MLTAATSFVASLLAALLIVVVRAQVAPEGGYGGLRQAPFEALLTGLFGPLVLWLLRRIDGRSISARSRVGLARGRPRSVGTAAAADDRRAAAMEIAGQDAELPEIRRRPATSWSSWWLVFLAIAVRLFYLQVIEGDTSTSVTVRQHRAHRRCCRPCAARSAIARGACWRPRAPRTTSTSRRGSVTPEGFARAAHGAGA